MINILSISLFVYLFTTIYLRSYFLSSANLCFASSTSVIPGLYHCHVIREEGCAQSDHNLRLIRPLDCLF
jgi:hypothetical protein